MLAINFVLLLLGINCCCSYCFSGIEMTSPKIQTVQQILLFLWLTGDHTIFAARNQIAFERFLCPLSKEQNVLSHFSCPVKYIDWNHLKFDIHFTFAKPVHQFWVHSVLYYKFNGLIYQKFPINLWEDFCEWNAARLAGKFSSHVLNWTFGKLIDHTNLNHTCPLLGSYFMTVSNISIDAFVVEPLLPSGRYRLEMDYSEGYHAKRFHSTHVYFSISDHRLEII